MIDKTIKKDSESFGGFIYQWREELPNDYEVVVECKVSLEHSKDEEKLAQIERDALQTIEMQKLALNKKELIN